MNTRKYDGLDPDIVRGLDALATQVAKVVQAKRRTCMTCVHFDLASEGCKQANNQRPPARVIAYGCGSYVEDDIPF